MIPFDPKPWQIVAFSFGVTAGVLIVVAVVAVIAYALIHLFTGWTI